MCSSLGTQEQVDISLMKVHESGMHPAGGSRTTRLHDGSIGDPRGCGERSADST